MSLQVSRILHAGYLFELDGCRIVFDPIFESPFSRNCYSFPEVAFDTEAIRKLKLDAIFISHYHDDHFSLESLNLLDRDIPVYIFSVFEELVSLITELGFKNVYAIQILRPITIGPFEVKALEALDADVDSIFHIKVAGLNILNVVDSWIGPVTFERLLATSWDLVLWPFQTMREIEAIAPLAAAPPSEKTCQLPIEWLDQLQQLKPKIIVPSSCQFRFEEWSWLNQIFFPISYAGFESQMLEILPQTKVQRLDPGETLSFSGPKNRLHWVKPLKYQNVDYEFQPNTRPQTLPEIAQKLSSLTAPQQELVHRFCQTEIKDRFVKLADFEDNFFAKSQLWHLKVYDHQGLCRDYFYKISQNKMNKISPPSNKPTWLTEIPESKLWGALSEGESLTSLHIRVTPLPKADPLADPLIRCLYEGVIGGYQKAQLKKLQNL